MLPPSLFSPTTQGPQGASPNGSTPATSRFTLVDLADPSSLAKELKTPTIAFSPFLVRLLERSSGGSGGQAWQRADAPSEEVRKSLIDALDRVIGGDPIWKVEGFEKAEAAHLLPSDAHTKVDESRIANINRLLLEGVYPSEFWGQSSFCCAVGMSAAPCWDCDKANQLFGATSDGVARRSRDGTVIVNPGLPDNHALLKACRFWSTGTLIHERVVVTAAHAPRSPLVMGDRVLLPAVEGKPFPQRILRVSRIIDHPKAATDPSCDVRLILLHYDERGSAEQKARINLIRAEIGRRKCLLGDGSNEENYAVFGFQHINAVGSDQKFIQNVRSAGAADMARHGHAPDREFVISAKQAQPSGGPRASSEFGDSGAPVVVRRNGQDQVVGMYVRRSTNRPVSEKPDLVVIRLHEALRSWGVSVLARHGITLPGLADSSQRTPTSGA